MKVVSEKQSRIIKAQFVRSQCHEMCGKFKEEIRMMAQSVCRESIVTKHIFGSYIYNTRVVPRKQKVEEKKEKIRQLFEIVDDYIEQA